MDMTILARMEEVEDDFWLDAKVARTLPDDDYVMAEPSNTTITYEE